MSEEGVTEKCIGRETFLPRGLRDPDGRCQRNFLGDSASRLYSCLCSTTVPEDVERKSTSSGDDDKSDSLPRKSPAGGGARSATPVGARDASESPDRAASQPNIAHIPRSALGLPIPNRSSYPLSGSSSSASSDLMSGSLYSSTTSSGSSPSLTNRDDGFVAADKTTTPEDHVVSHVVDSYFLDDDRLDKSPEDLGLGDLEHDINSALEEIMSGVKSLELQQKDETKDPPTSGMPPKFPVGNTLKDTPDLVLNLPVGDDVREQPSPKSVHSGTSVKTGSSTDSDSPTLSTAELFANNNQCTMKKGSSMPRNVTPPGGGSKLSGDVKRSYSTAGTTSSRGKYPVASPQTAVEIDPGETIWETQKPALVAPRRTPPPPRATTASPSGGGVVLRQAPLPPSGGAGAPASERLLGNRSSSPAGGVSSSGPSLVPTTIPHPAPRLTPVSQRKDLQNKPAPPEKPKPPPKSTKPRLMKKPARSPDVARRVDRGSKEEEQEIGQSTC